MEQPSASAAPAPIIDVMGLHKVYRIGQNQVHALCGVSLTIQPGEFVSIVGTSGSGKSTLLNMLAGLEHPTRGTIRVAGYQLEKLSENALVRYRREHVGFIFQSFNLLPTLTTLENVALPLQFRGVPERSRNAQAAKLLQTVGLGEHLRHRPVQLSGGQQQRVGVARALVVNPAIVFADEPTGNLDSHTAADLMALMRSIVRDRGQTLVMVTHDHHLASYADRILHISDGEITCIEDHRTTGGEEL